MLKEKLDEMHYFEVNFDLKIILIIVDKSSIVTKAMYVMTFPFSPLVNFLKWTLHNWL